MIELRGVSKSLGGRAALRDVSLMLTGGCVALVGANGSGKTTLLRLVASLIRPDAGQMCCDGSDYRMQVSVLRQSTGYMPQAAEFPSNLTPRVLLRYLAQLRRVADLSRPEALLARLHLTAAADKPLTALSGGQVRLVCLAQAFLSQPMLLLLDEVFSGMGIQERQAAARLMSVGNPARLTLFSTHELDDAARLASHLIVLREGRVRYYGTIGALRRAHPAESLDRIYARLVES